MNKTILIINWDYPSNPNIKIGDCVESAFHRHFKDIEDYYFEVGTLGTFRYIPRKISKFTKYCKAVRLFWDIVWRDFETGKLSLRSGIDYKTAWSVARGIWLEE